MKLKKRRTSKELLVFTGLFLIIFVTIFHLLLFGHTRAVAMYDTNASVGAGQPGNQKKIQTAASSAENVIRHTRAEDLGSFMQTMERNYELKQISVADSLGNAVFAPRNYKIAHAPNHKARAQALAHIELRKMEKSLTALVRQNALPPEMSVNKYRSEVSALHLKQMIQQSEDRFLYSSDSNRTLQRVNAYGETELPGGNYFTRNSAKSVVDESRTNLDAPSAQHGGDNAFPDSRKINRQDLQGSQNHNDLKEVDQMEMYDLKLAVVDNINSFGNNINNDNISEELVVKANEWNVSRNTGGGEMIAVRRDTMCKAVPDGLEGVTRDVHLDIEVDIDALTKSHTDILPGGEWKPSNCISRHRLAIIIPYRDRWNHLKVLLHYLLPLLKRQQIHFRIIVVEQYGNQTFNKGRIMNAAYRETLKLFDFRCVIFHDVDLVPEDDRNIYSCAKFPKHMSTAIDKFNYHLPYQGLVGGVLSFRVEHFQLVNGYSNMYWGWGGEDDDMTNRILSKSLRIFRPPNNVARYKMVKHQGRRVSQIRLKLLRTAARRGRVEGLNNVPYHLVFAHNEKLFTHFMVDVGEP